MSNLIALVCSLGIAVQQSLLFVLFSERSKIGAVVALGCGLAAVVTLAMSKIDTYALIPLNLKSVDAGAPKHRQSKGSPSSSTQVLTVKVQYPQFLLCCGCDRVV